MFSVSIPKAIRKAARGVGVQVSSKIKMDPKPHLTRLSSQLRSAPAVKAFVVPAAGVNAKTALGAAGRILGTAGAGQAVQNTQALAALGDPDALRGLVALHAAQKARTEGKPLPPISAGTKPVTFSRTYAKGEVNALANRTVARTNPAAVKPAKPKVVASATVTTKDAKPGIWTRFKRWLGKKL